VVAINAVVMSVKRVFRRFIDRQFCISVGLEANVRRDLRAKGSSAYQSAIRIAPKKSAPAQFARGRIISSAFANSIKRVLPAQSSSGIEESAGCNRGETN
jgi:hypothetical protein